MKEIQKKWWHKSVIYQIYPRSFYDSNGDGVGDLQGIIQKLDYVKLLGVDVIWLSPIYDSPNVDNGYDISDYCSISSEFGTMEDMNKLLLESSKRGIKIIMDLVVNHTSDQHPWFIEAKKSKDNPYRDYYIWRDPVNGKEPNELKSNFGGSAWEFDETTNQYYLHFYSKEQPDLDWGNQKMRSSIWDMMNFWINKGIGGFRMDVIDLIGKDPDKQIKENGPKLHDYLQEMNQKTFGNKDLLTVGETWGATTEDGKLYSDPEGKELSMIFQFEHIQLDKIPGKQRWDLKKLELDELKQVLSKWQYALNEDGWNSLFWNNHDLPRIVSRWGNDREYRVESAKMLATLLHGMKGTPYIYQGEEIGMTNAAFESIEDYIDIETQNIYKERTAAGFSEEDIMESLYMKARDNARTPMQWSNATNAGFSSGKPWMKLNPNYPSVNVESALIESDSVFYHYQKLITIRKQNQTLVYGTYRLLDSEPNIYAYERILEDKKLLIVCNFYEPEAAFSYSTGSHSAVNLLISNYSHSSSDLKNITLRPYEAIMYEII
ncbi:oligo-1,6-glucosidase/glucan 1,6-alpha-glucosidase [Paenibacillus forsythiae]|uniref:Oligo-1,6-glucosidase/glucan 1,6-alpha-glucosidase n=1 Tax=Paenibacillus forsythiae TaxID=365616 RepID=A0ABU3HC94_9BACL|nr:alpha-glucosidase [Paenibacillus forsythiae]MDT3428434.1 oligo-1,6-glucosidase/glucan 1,6-alpha-glucosidase [Paenibacillus forsythiae]